MARRLARASASTGRVLPVSASARASSCSSAASSSRLQHQHLAARQQRAVQGEGRVFRGRADQGDGAVLHHRQEAILLRAVEAVDFIDEQQRRLPRALCRAASSNTRLRSATPENTAEIWTKMQPGLIREQPRDGGLADAGRTPEDQGGERAARQHPRQRAVRAERWSCPTTSASVAGRSRSARGRGFFLAAPPAVAMGAAVVDAGPKRSPEGAGERATRGQPSDKEPKRKGRTSRPAL